MRRKYGNERSPVWFIMKIRDWYKENIGDLNNDYLKNSRPADKFLREQYLVIVTDK